MPNSTKISTISLRDIKQWFDDSGEFEFSFKVEASDSRPKSHKNTVFYVRNKINGSIFFEQREFPKFEEDCHIALGYMHDVLTWINRNNNRT